MRKTGALLSTLVLAALVATPAQGAPGDIYIGDSDSSQVLRLAPGGGTPSLVSNDSDFVTPNSVEVAYDGKLLVTDYDAFSIAGGLLSLDRSTGVATPFAGGAPFVQPDGMALAPGKIAYVSDLDATASSGAIFRVSLVTKSVALFSSGGLLSDALGVAVEPATGRIFATAGVNVLTIGPGGDPSVFDTPGSDFQGLGGIVRMPDGKLYVQDNDHKAVYSVDSRTGATKLVAQDNRLATSYDLTYDLNGNLVIADGDSGVFGVNPRNGAVTELTPGVIGSYYEGVGVEPTRCGGKVATIQGTNQSETIVGSPKADVISGIGGKDKIRSLGGNDIVCGGAGKDKLLGGKGRDRLNGGPGRDKLKGGPGRDHQAQ